MIEWMTSSRYYIVSDPIQILLLSINNEIYIYILQERKIRVFRRTEGIQIVVVVSLWVDRTVSQFVGVGYLNSVLIGVCSTTSWDAYVVLRLVMICWISLWCRDGCCFLNSPSSGKSSWKNDVWSVSNAFTFINIGGNIGGSKLKHGRKNKIKKQKNNN